MAAGLMSGGSANGPRRRRKRRIQPMAEINVTPFVDVMLVLLIIFMVSAPLLTVGVPIELPETVAGPLDNDTEPLTVSVSAEGRVFLQDNEVTPDQLIATLQAISQNGLNEKIFVRGDRAAEYATVMSVMGRLNEAGYRRIGLVTLQETDG